MRQQQQQQRKKRNESCFCVNRDKESLARDREGGRKEEATGGIGTRVAIFQFVTLFPSSLRDHCIANSHSPNRCFRATNLVEHLANRAPVRQLRKKRRFPDAYSFFFLFSSDMDDRMDRLWLPLVGGFRISFSSSFCSRPQKSFSNQFLLASFLTSPLAP
jgi:hypothetical protein